MTKNYVSLAKRYAKAALTAKWAGKWTRLACKRFLDDLKRSDLKFSPKNANAACKFMELLPHVEGVWDKPTIVLHRSDVFFIVNLFFD